MKFEKYLTERTKIKTKYGDTGDFTNQEIDKAIKIAAMIEKHCKPFMKVIRRTRKHSYGFLYRGKYAFHYDIKKIKPRRDRSPKDTHWEVQNALDQAFDSKFGFMGRSEGVFCTSDRGQARNYGDAHMVFPVSRFDFLWSPDIADIYSQVLSDGKLVEIIPTFFDDKTKEEYFKDDWEEEYGPESGEGMWISQTDWEKWPGEDIDNVVEEIVNRTIDNLEFDLQYNINHKWDEDSPRDQKQRARLQKEIDDFDTPENRKQLAADLKWEPEKDFEDFSDSKIQDLISSDAYLEDDWLLEQLAEYIIKEYRYQMGNHDKAIISGNELMLDCRDYFMVNENFSIILEAILLDGQEIEGSQLSFKFK